MIHDSSGSWINVKMDPSIGTDPTIQVQCSSLKVAVTSITSGVVVSAALSFAPVVGDSLRIGNAPGKTCGTPGVFAVTVADSTTGYTLDTDMANVADATLCVVVYASPCMLWSEGGKTTGINFKNAHKGVGVFVRNGSGK